MNNRGFTLIELLIAFSIMVIISAFSLGLTSRSYSRGSMESERDTIVSLLQQIRNKAMANVGQSNHGLFVATSSYILFEGNSYASRDISKDESFPKSESISVGGATEIIFSALEATSTGGVMLLTDSLRTEEININPEGRISW